MKVNIIIFKKDKSMYGFSTNPKYVDLFITQRNANNFIVKQIKMSKEEYGEFVNLNYLLNLSEILLYDGAHNLYLIGTLREEDKLSYICDKIIIYLEKTKYYFSKILNESSLKIIEEATTLINNKKNGNNDYLFAELNTFKLFYNLFKNTFTEADDESSSIFQFIKEEF